MPHNPSVVQLGGKARVTCVHNRVKRAHTQQEFDPLTEEPYVCICCENMFVVRKRDDDGNPICLQCRKRD